jgi:hypothetical protein
VEGELHLLSPWRAPHSPEGLVRELKREVGSKHPLYAKSAKALAVAKDRDDVLFEITDSVSRRYAVVHLGWTGRFENSGVWPRTELFDSLEQWLDWMKADHEDYTYGDDAAGSMS